MIPRGRLYGVARREADGAVRVVLGGPRTDWQRATFPGGFVAFAGGMSKRAARALVRADRDNDADSFHILTRG